MKCLLAFVLTLSATIGMTMGARCRVDGGWKDVGDQWSPDACQDCECRLNGDGQAETACAVMSCMAPLCDNPIESDDVCCPQCPPGCEVDGTWKLVGESWNEGDCTFCTCAEDNGQTQVHCAVTDCAIPEGCPNPFNVDGECCPHCCEVGSSWKPDPCTDCQCEQGGYGFSCASMSCMPPPCSNPIYSDDTCCGECPPGCATEYGYKEIGESWAPDACTHCDCVDDGNGQAQEMCAMMSCMPPLCDNPIYSEEVCCPQCPAGCDFDGTLMPVGSSWEPDACTHCMCDQNANGQSQSQCAMTDCGPIPDVCNPVHAEGDCCSQCCEVGTSWSPNACTDCHCEMGDTGSRAVCAIMDCAAPACDNPIFSDDQCCPQCPPICVVGTTRDEGPCTSCECTEDSNGRPQEECISMSCEEPSCEGYFTAPGDCCPQCPPLCTVGDRWDEDACTSCECTEDNNGQPQLECMSMSCEQPSCEGYFTAPGDCCPQCPPICVVGTTRDEGPCTSCECTEDSNGRPQEECISMSCMIPEGCPNPYHVEGECCPHCCEVGTSWSPDTCTDCQCVLDGGRAHAVCTIRGCPEPDCDDSYVPEGECCPKCTPICALVRCAQPDCPEENWVTLQGECCPRCDGPQSGCVLGKRRKIAGEPCNRCKCKANEDGSTQEVCKQRTCPALDCAVQVDREGKCCPKCVCDGVICPALDCPEKYQKKKRRNCCPNCTRRWLRIQQILARGN